MSELLEILVGSVRDGFVQVSAFVAITVVVFSYVQYRTGGRLVERLERNERAQPLIGSLLGLTPGCGGAIVMMPLYVRGRVSFGTVVATLITTAGDSAFVLLALAPEAAVYAYGISFVAAVVSGYAIDRFGLGVGRIDRAVARLRTTATDGGTMARATPAANPSHEYDGVACSHEHGSSRETGVMTWLSHVAHVAWWATALVALVAGTVYLLRGAPD
ncbi:MAG: putative manganese transporter, partial [Halalkalicoccus sp.]|nr:putative manganese transporter [Halalkalicoccus sp.]